MTPHRAAHITGWGRYAPSQVLTNKDLERMVDTSDEWIVTRTGIRERRVAAAHETTASMAAVAGLRAIRTAGLEPDAIDLILVATLTPDYPMPSTAALVKEAIGNTRAAAMDVAAACSGFVYAYATAHAYVTLGACPARPRIGAELLTRFLDYTDRNTCILFGDGAGAVVRLGCGRSGRRPRHRAHDRAAGCLHDLAASRRGQEPIVVGDSRTRRALRPDGGPGDLQVRHADARLDRAGPIRHAGLDPSDIDRSSRTRPTSGSSRPSPRASTCRWIGCSSTSTRYGNTSAASVPIALAEAVTPVGSIGDRIVIVAFGAGFTSGAVASSGLPTRPGRSPARPAVQPAECPVRLPVDWDSVDPIRRRSLS